MSPDGTLRFDLFLSSLSNVFLFETCVLMSFPAVAGQVLSATVPTSIALLAVFSASADIAFLQKADACSSAAAIACVGISVLGEAGSKRSTIWRLTAFAYGLWTIGQLPYWDFEMSGVLHLIYLYSLSVIALGTVILTIIYFLTPLMPPLRPRASASTQRKIRSGSALLGTAPPAV